MHCMAVDACCLINLLAAGKILVPATNLQISFHVPTTVAQESVYLLQPDKDQPEKLVRTEINLTELAQDGRIHYCDVEGSYEGELFVQFAVKLDDGEAACLAIAKSRSWSVASDDRIARRLALEHNVPIVGTPELVKHWADAHSATDQDVAEVISQIEKFAKYVPRANVPEATWWNQMRDCP